MCCQTDKHQVKRSWFEFGMEERSIVNSASGPTDEDIKPIASQESDDDNQCRTLNVRPKTLYSTENSYDPLIVLGINLTPLHPTVQFYICAGGVFGFTIIYGYLQELLSVHIMGRNYAMFLSVCQLAGYSFWSNILMFVSKHRRSQIIKSLEKKNEEEEKIDDNEVGSNAAIYMESLDVSINDSKSVQAKKSQIEQNDNDNNDNDEERQSLQSSDEEIKNMEQVKLLPSPESKAEESNHDEYDTDNKHGPPIYIYMALSLVRAIDIGLTNGAMKFLNYPAKTLIKSSRVAFTMLGGLVIGKKRYKILDYIMVSMLVLGLSFFLHADFRTKAVFHPIGVIMLV
jgi:hypothetical protein